MQDFVISVQIKQKGNGDKYEPVILDTGFTNIVDAIKQVNHTLDKKFGVKDRFEIVKEHGGHKKARED